MAVSRLEKSAELLARTADGDKAHVHEPLLHLRLRDDLRNFGVEAIDYDLWRARRHDEARPSVEVVPFDSRLVA